MASARGALSSGVRRQARLAHMGSLTLLQIRWLAAAYLALLLLAAGNHYLEWGLAGSADRKILAVVTFVGFVVMARYGSSLLRMLEDHKAAERLVEAEAERLRD